MRGTRVVGSGANQPDTATKTWMVKGVSGTYPRCACPRYEMARSNDETSGDWRRHGAVLASVGCICSASECSVYSAYAILGGGLLYK